MARCLSRYAILLTPWQRQFSRCLSGVPLHVLRIGEKCQVPTYGLINGQWLPSYEGGTFPVTNPATEEVIANVADMGYKETGTAIECAYKAQPRWANQPLQERVAVLKKWHSEIMKNRLDLARLITLEAGKPFSESLKEVDYSASFIEFFAEEAKSVRGEIFADPRTRQRQLMILREPVGVAGLVTPWNFPAAMILRKAAPALAIGCSVVLKPAEDTPLIALALAQMITDHAGIPPGILNVITSSRKKAQEIGEMMAHSTKVGVISMTGSTQTGKFLMEHSASTVKKMCLELGGNAPFIVFDSADIKKAVDGCMASKFRNAGQTCVCANRIFVQESIHDQFVAEFTERVLALRIGNGLEDGVEIGPLINERGVEKVEMLVKATVAQGAKIQTGGGRWQNRPTFYEPTVLTGVTNSMPVAANEIFGPVASIIKFNTEEEVLALANDVNMGLASYFYSEDYRQIWRVSQKLQFGMVAVNEAQTTMDVAPSSGRKQSGIGTEASHYGFDDFLEFKFVCMGGDHGL